LIGDGKRFLNGIGNVGERAFTLEANYGDFSCSGINSDACNLVDRNVSSAAANCKEVQAYYQQCYDQYTFNNDKCNYL
jgi:hypothetical protein